MEKPSKIYYTLILLALVGLVFSGLLLYLDYQVLFVPDYSPGCNINAAFNCKAVAQSPYAFLLGIPVAAWGILGYLLVLTYMLLFKDKQIYLHLMIAYILFSVVSLIYFGITKIELHTMCIYCLVTYIVNWISALILIVFWMMKGDHLRIGLKDVTFRSSQIGTLIILPFLVLLPSALAFHGDKIQAPSPKISSPYQDGRFDSAQARGMVGPKEAKVVLELFSDFECPYCAMFEPILQNIMKNFSNVKLIRYEFPLDHQCNAVMGGRQLHLNACQAAFFVKCAGAQDMFWEAAELLHENHEHLNPGNLKNFINILKLDSKKMNYCMISTRTQDSVQKDIALGLKKELTSTPTLYINGKKHSMMAFDKLKATIVEAGGEPIKK